MVSPADYQNQVLHLLESEVKLSQPRLKSLFFSQTERFLLSRFSSTEIADGMLKLLIKPSPVTRNQFVQEIKVLEWLADRLPRSSHIPRLFHYRLKPETWQISRFVSGQLLNDQAKSFFYFPNRLGCLDPGEVARFFLLLRQDLKEMDLPVHNEVFLRPVYNRFLLQLSDGEHRFSKTSRVRLIKLLSDKLEWLFDQRNFGLLHYDLSPVNIVVKDNNFVLIDWENVAKGHFLGDLVNFWARTSLLPGWQTEFFNQVTLRSGSEVRVWFQLRFLLQSVGILNYLIETGNTEGYDLMVAKIEKIAKKYQ